MRPTPARVLYSAAVALALLAPTLDAQRRVPAVVTEAELDPDEGVNFHAYVEPDTVYVGQQATYQVGVFLDGDVRARLRRNPEFVPPEMRSMLAYELPTGHAFVARPGGGGRYEVHIFERAVFPLTAGTLEIPPATLNYALPLSPSFFSREEAYTARSQSRRLVALPPPAAGRPADWNGAIGLLAVSARLDTAGARVGDPLVLTVRVTGRGNVNLFPRPALPLTWGTAVATDERVQLDTGSYVVTGTKEFDWIVTPREAGRIQMPAVRYPYFDPVQRRYAVALTQPESLVVAPGTLAAADSGERAVAPLELRPLYRGERGPLPVETPWYWLAVTLLPVPAGIAAVWRRPRRLRIRSASEVLRRLATDGSTVSARRLRRAFTRAVAERLGMRELAPLQPGSAARLLRREGVSPQAAQEADAFLEELDAAAFSGRDTLVAGGARRAAALFATIDAEARRRRATPPSVRALGITLVVAVAGGAGLVTAARAAAADHAASLFSRGVKAYDAGAYTAAVRLFGGAAQQAPAAPDAWANLGTAAWAARDTGRAVLGWQRALRLEPLAGDVRDRLHLVGGAEQGRAGVPALPPAPLQWAALLVWTLGCVSAAAVLARRRRLSSPVVVAPAVVALLLAGTAVWLHARLEGRDLAVVAASGPLRAAPAFGAEARLTLMAGEVAVVRGRQGAWTRLAADGEREGWMESERVISLGPR